MEKLVSITIHTERLHDDKVWRQVNSLLKFFRKYKVKATWFSINPTFIGYKYDEKKWIERLNFIKNSGQEIQQHTHFYKGKEGVRKGIGYDLGWENARKRLLEDGEWLENSIGLVPKGFISGAWRTSKEVHSLLKELGYKYDITSRGRKVAADDGFLEIPTTSSLRGMLKNLLFLPLSFRKQFICCPNLCFYVLYFHDYDLERTLFLPLLKLSVLYLEFFNFQFVSMEKLFTKIKKHYSFK